MYTAALSSAPPDRASGAAVGRGVALPLSARLGEFSYKTSTHVQHVDEMGPVVLTCTGSAAT